MHQHVHASHHLKMRKFCANRLISGHFCK